MTSPSSSNGRTDGVAERAARVFDFVIDGGAALAAALLIAVMLTTTIKVVFRFGLEKGLIGVDQISGTMLLCIAFLGAALGVKREEHVTRDIALNALRPKYRRQFLVSGSIVGGLVCLILSGVGTAEVISSLQRDIRIPAELEIPRAINLVVIPIGCLFLGLQFLRRAWRIGRSSTWTLSDGAG